MSIVKEFQKVTETEMQIMEVIWEMNRPVKSNELLHLFSKTKGKEWKGQTIATFLSRLVNKGILSMERVGKSNIYTTRMSLKEYKKREAQSVLDTMYQGSVNNFLATLYDEKVTPEELTKLQKWFSDK